MSTPAPLSPSVLAPKPHYAALDGLRGVAAVMVVLFHMFEGSARDFQFHTDQIHQPRLSVRGLLLHAVRLRHRVCL